MAEILVEFIPDFTKLENGVDKLVSDNTISKEMASLFTDAGKSLDQFAAKFSKIDAGGKLKPALDAAKKSVKDLSTSGITDLGELKKRVDGITKSFTDGFGEGVKEALNEAGISLEQFQNAVTKNVDTDRSLKAELREINEQLTQMKLNGQGNTQQYQELSKKAGQYRDAIQDVNEEINRQASDTQKLDVAIRFVTQLSSAYSVLQGIQGLVGKDNEELQKTLLKVNSAMAILNGLQSIQNELKRKDNILTIAQTTLQKGYALVVGNSTGALKAFRIALASTGIGLLILAVGALVANWDKIRAAIGGVSDAQKDLIDNAEKLVDTGEDNLEILESSEETLRRQGVSEEEITRQKIKQLQINKQNLLDLLELRRATLESQKEAQQRSFSIVKTIVDIFTLPLLGLSKLISAITGKKLPTIGDIVGQKLFDPKEIDKDFKELEEKTKLETTRIQGQIDGLLNGIDDKRKQKAEKAADDRAKIEKEELEKRLALLQRVLENEVAQAKLRLLQVEKGSVEELELKKKLLQAELRLELNNDKLTSDQRKLLIQESFKERRELTDEFNSENKKRVLEDQASVITAQLNALNLSNEEKTRLTIEQLEIEKQLQLDAVINNETKRKEITAKFEKEIFEVRKKAREDAFQQELSDLEAANHQRVALAQRAAANEDLPTNKRVEALQEELSIELEIINKKRFENQRLLNDKLITLEEYNRRAKDLSNDEFDAKSKNEAAYTELVDGEAEKRLAKLKETVGKIAEVANTIIESLKTFNDSMNANEDARVEAQRDSLQRLRDLNAITEKEFIAKNKVIDRLERSTKQKQAEREKGLALFQALINGASAIVEAAPNPFLIAATAALVAAQIAAIASRPVPKFGKGTKKAPEGFAQVGETGTELIQMGDKYFIASHPQVIWMKGGERVYNPEETKDILTPQANMTVINNSNGVSHETKVDYDKMAKKIGEEIAKHPRLINNIDADGYSLHIIEGLNKSKYLNKRFTFK